MNIKAQIPNLFTMLNLFSGCVALVMIASWKFDWAFYFVCLGIFIEFSGKETIKKIKENSKTNKEKSHFKLKICYKNQSHTARKQI